MLIDYLITKQFQVNVYIYHTFFLIEEQRNKNLKTKLLDYVLNNLKEKGYTEFTVGVHDENKIAKHIYFERSFDIEITSGFELAKYLF